MPFTIQDPFNPDLKDWTPDESWNVPVPDFMSDEERSIYNVYLNFRLAMLL